MQCAPARRVISPHFASSTPSFAVSAPRSSGDAARPDSNDAQNSPSSSSSFSHVLATYSKSDEDSANRAPAKAAKDPSDSEGKSADDPSAAALVLPTPPPAPLTITGLLGLLQQQPQKDAQGTEKTGDSAADPAQAEASQEKTQPNVSAPKSLPLTATLALPVSTTKAGSKAADAKMPPKMPAPQMPLAFASPVEIVRAAGETDSAPNEAAVDAAAGGTNAVPAQPTGNTTPANGAAAMAAHAPLAFSMLVSPESQNAAPSNAQTAAGAPDPPALAADAPHFSSALATAAAAIEAAPVTVTEHSSDAQSNTMAAPLVQGETAASSDDRVTAVPSASATSAADVDSGAAASRNDAVRNVRLQLDGDNNQRVDVRLTETGGELRVNVRSADATLTQAMQDHMPELTNRLDQQHFRTEVWLPRSSQTSNSDGSNTRGSQSQTGDASGQQNSGRRQNGRQNNQQDWQNEDVPGQTNTKEINHIWQA